MVGDDLELLARHLEDGAGIDVHGVSSGSGSGGPFWSGWECVALALHAFSDLVPPHERVGDGVAQEQVAVILAPLVGGGRAVLAAGGQIGLVLRRAVIGPHRRIVGGAGREERDGQEGEHGPHGRIDTGSRARYQAVPPAPMLRAPCGGGSFWPGSRMCWRSTAAAPARGPS